MKLKLNSILFLGTILILLSVLGGVFLPHLFFTGHIQLLQFIFVIALLFLSLYIVMLLIGKRFSKLTSILDQLMNNPFSIKFSNVDNSLFLKYTRYFYNHIEDILEKFNNFIFEQHLLLKKYTLLNKQLENNNMIRDVMLEVSNSIIGIDDSEKLLNLILSKIVNIIEDAEKGSILVLKDNNSLEFKASIGFDLEKLKDISLSIEESFLWKASNGDIKKPCIIRDIRSFNSFNLDTISYKSFENADALDIEASLSAPIIIDGNLYGMINIDSTHMNAFNNEDLVIMEYFSNQISIAIKNHQLIEKTLTLSRYDSLTNAYNRCYFEELLNKAYKRALRYEEIFCLVVFDLDKLKEINDTLGHSAGDEFLKKFSHTMIDNIRETDLFARYGGDEFLGAFFYTDIDSIINRIEKIKSILEGTPLIYKENSYVLTFSYGIACYPQDSKDLDSLLQIADKRMYQQKNR